ncbi:Oidioi.mRNA.OKI2018_I69.chr1.g641.t1.cds [Oikopleura dioica]|uniref:Oidioi.mRNA.OKI2018_I69.chr1.g641.t1.cds n=1 Tax=Oikopleura dioica TaxID=34765 RepID=A0ABN7SKZ0_OIKDI|nr:Oidioi.mRNA.OKI2018_I69.chr1.g641.t1.cds [Oikopleura dioica]
MTTANCILINEANPHMVKFKVRGKPAFIDDEDSQLSILGFIRAVSDQFAKQAGRKINLWREIPCKLNFSSKFMFKTNGNRQLSTGSRLNVRRSWNSSPCASKMDGEKDLFES